MSLPKSFQDALRYELMPKTKRVLHTLTQISESLTRLQAIVNTDKVKLAEFETKITDLSKTSAVSVPSLLSVSLMLASSGLTLDEIYVNLVKRFTPT